MKARAKGEGRIYQLPHLCVAGSSLNDAAGHTEERIPFNIHLTEIWLTVMERWVADGLEQASAQWYQDARSFCLGVNLLVRGSSPPPRPPQFSWPKKAGSALMAYWPVPAAINKHKAAWLVPHDNPGHKICIIWLSFFTSLYLPFSAPVFSQVNSLSLITFLLLVPDFWHPYPHMALWCSISHIWYYCYGYIGGVGLTRLCFPKVSQYSPPTACGV